MTWSSLGHCQETDFSTWFSNYDTKTPWIGGEFDTKSLWTEGEYDTKKLWTKGEYDTKKSLTKGVYDTKTLWTFSSTSAMQGVGWGEMGGFCPNTKLHCTVLHCH